MAYLIYSCASGSVALEFSLRLIASDFSRSVYYIFDDCCRCVLHTLTPLCVYSSVKVKFWYKCALQVYVLLLPFLKYMYWGKCWLVTIGFHWYVFFLFHAEIYSLGSSSLRVFIYWVSQCTWCVSDWSCYHVTSSCHLQCWIRDIKDKGLCLTKTVDVLPTTQQTSY